MVSGYQLLPRYKTTNSTQNLRTNTSYKPLTINDNFNYGNVKRLKSANPMNVTDSIL